MLELNRAQRGVLSDKLPDAANVAAGGLIFGQILADRPFSPVLAVIGLGIWAVCIAVALLLAKGEP